MERRQSARGISSSRSLFSLINSIFSTRSSARFARNWFLVPRGLWLFQKTSGPWARGAGCGSKPSGSIVIQSMTELHLSSQYCGILALLDWYLPCLWCQEENNWRLKWKLKSYWLIFPAWIIESRHYPEDLGGKTQEWITKLLLKVNNTTVYKQSGDEITPLKHLKTLEAVVFADLLPLAQLLQVWTFLYAILLIVKIWISGFLLTQTHPGAKFNYIDSCFTHFSLLIQFTY